MAPVFVAHSAESVYQTSVKSLSFSFQRLENDS